MRITFLVASLFVAVTAGAQGTTTKKVDSTVTTRRATASAPLSLGEKVKLNKTGSLDRLTDTIKVDKTVTKTTKVVDSVKVPVVAKATPAKPSKKVAKRSAKKSGGHIGTAFTGKITKDQLVKATRNCDKRIIRINCTDMLAEANRVIGKKFGIHFANLGQYADFLDRAIVAPCPAGEMARLSRGLGTRVLANDNWQRLFRVGEMCLYVDNLLIVSLDCSNPAKSDHYLRAAVIPEAANTEPVSEVRQPVVFIPPAEPLGAVVTPPYKKGFPTKRVLGGIGLIALTDAILCQWVDDRFCLLRIKMHQEQTQTQSQE